MALVLCFCSHQLESQAGEPLRALHSMKQSSCLLLPFSFFHPLVEGLLRFLSFTLPTEPVFERKPTPAQQIDWIGPAGDMAFPIPSQVSEEVDTLWV